MTGAREDDHGLGERQQRFQREEMRAALRALLMTPLMDSGHEDFAAVRRHADRLREWFARETGWVLHVERDGARLYKRPADLVDATRGLPGYDRRRYVLLCLACAVLERADPQITLRLLGERLLELAADPALAALGFTFTLGAQHERRELVAVCRTLLALGVLQHVAGDEEAFVQAAGAAQADALYDVQRRTLAGMLAAVRGPSTWTRADAPAALDDRLHALVDEHVADSDEGRRTAMRHDIARRLLDDPVVYLDKLAPEVRTYFLNQRGAMAGRLCEASGLVAEQRAEGLALVDEAGLSDVAMPSDGTDAHVTLLAADYLVARQRLDRAARGDASAQASTTPREQDIAEFLRDARERYGRYWRKSAREPGSERELAAIAVDRLERLKLVERRADFVHPLPALARFALGDAEVREVSP
jgi:uncharacterized protein (TIGR02678 family)